MHLKLNYFKIEFSYGKPFMYVLAFINLLEQDSDVRNEERRVISIKMELIPVAGMSIYRILQ